VQTIMSKLVDIEPAPLPRGVPKAGGDIVERKGAVLRLDCLEDDSPWARGAGNIHFDAAWEL
jgi:hypothetical protein